MTGEPITAFAIDIEQWIYRVYVMLYDICTRWSCYLKCSLGKKVRVKCNPDDTVGDLKKLIAAQTGTRADKIRLQVWYFWTFLYHLPFFVDSWSNRNGTAYSRIISHSKTMKFMMAWASSCIIINLAGSFLPHANNRLTSLPSHFMGIEATKRTTELL
jgi:hypothetical protein